MKKKVLIVSQTPTHPTVAGNRKCILDYTDLIKHLGYDVYFLYVNHPFLSKKEKEETRKYWRDHFLFFKTTKTYKYKRLILGKIRSLFFNGYNRVDDYYPCGLTKYINQLHKELNFESIIINYVFLSKLFLKLPVKNKIIFTHDAQILKKIRTGNNNTYSLTPNEESKGLRRCPIILSIQQNEAVYYSYAAPLSRIYTVYSPTINEKMPLVYNKNILFFSGPNEFNLNGIKYFINKIMHRLNTIDSEIRLLIGGKICDELEKEQLPHNVILKGIFKDSMTFYALGDIVINPTFQGTGLKIKTLESLSLGKCTIVHPHSLEGIYNETQAPIICCNTDDEWITAILKYLNNPSLLENMQEKSFNYIKNMNDYILKQYKKCLS